MMKILKLNLKAQDQNNNTYIMNRRRSNISSTKFFQKTTHDSKRYLLVKKPGHLKTPLNTKAPTTLSYIHFRKRNNVVQENINQSQKLKNSEVLNLNVTNFRKQKEQKLRKKRESLQLNFDNIKLLLRQKINEEEKEKEKLQKYYDENSRGKVISFSQSEYFEPKKYTQIIEKYASASEEKQIVFQFSKIQKKNQMWKKTTFSRYTYEQLSSFYVVLLDFAKGDISKFKRGFQVILNLSGLIIQQSQFEEEIQKVKIIKNFQTFAKLYKHFQQHHFKQSIIDSLKVLFHNYMDKEIEISLIKDIFQERIKEKEATILSQFFAQRISANYGSHTKMVTMKEIFELCYHENGLCQKIYEYYIKDTKLKKDQTQFYE